MATKLTANVAKRVKALGINATTDEAARPKLLEILEENGIEQMDDEDITTLVEIAESFVEAGDDDDNEGSEEEENDALAEEVEEEEEKPAKKATGKKAASKKQPEPEPEEEEEDEDDEEENEEEGDELDSMDRSELKTFIKENELEISVKKSWSDDDIREKIREAMGDEEEAEEEEEKPAPKKAAAAKGKTETKEAPKSGKKAEPKKEEKKAAKAPSKRGTKLDPKNNEEDREHFDFLKKLFPEKDYIYAWIAAGLTIKHKGKNSNRSVISLENCTLKGEGKNQVMTCNLFLLILNNKYEVLEKAEVEFEKCWNGAPVIKAIETSEAIEIIKAVKEDMDKLVGGIDKKLGDNRKKMEEGLKKDNKAGKKAAKQEEAEEEEDDEEEEEKPKAKAKPAKKGKKVEEPEEEEDEDEEEEEEKPAPKKSTKAAKPAAKKTVKKK